MEIQTAAYGGASRVEWEELLDNRMTMNDYYSLVLEGMDEAIYREIAKALVAAVGNIKAINKVVHNAFDETAMDQLLTTADAYGKSTIYCTFEFAATMIPANNATWSDGMKEQIWNNGYFTTYKGHQVIILPQSFTDVTNDEKVIVFRPPVCYII